MEFEAFLPAPHGQDHRSDMEGPEVPDGMKVDSEGNLYCTGPGGVLIFTPEGRHLGTIQPAEQPSNVAWGDADGKTLYICLLYTSPSPRDRTRSRMPSSA